MIRYLSVCAGIEAATVAWHPLGWTPAAFSEIDPFPRAVLAHHYPDVPLHGDFTTIGADDYGSIDLLVGGTPCQDFSVAGLRAGITGDRGNLTLEFLRLAARTQPRWIVWENVPGVLSIDGGRTFGAFLGGLAKLGYGFAYRVLDAQYFGVAQRRERVFVVAYSGDWRPPAAVLFERESLQWNPAPRREARKDAAPAISARTKGGGGLGTDFDCDGGLVTETVGALCADAHPGAYSWQDAYTGRLIAHALRAEGFDASEDGTGRGTPLVAHALDARQSDVIQYGDKTGPLDTDGHTIGVLAFTAKDHGADAGPISPTLRAGGHAKSHANGGVMPAVAYAGVNHGKLDDGALARAEDLSAGAMRDLRRGKSRGPSQGRRLAQQPAEQSRAAVSELSHQGASAEAEMQSVRRPSQGVGLLQQTPAALQEVGRSARREGEPKHAGMQVRRLTPRECERLQGFPDDYTLVPYRNKPASDGPRYKALGNSMAVPCMAWIGERIAFVENLTEKAAT